MESMTLIHTAEDAERMGKRGVAINLYQQALDDYPNSTAAQKARTALNRLQGAAAGPQQVAIVDVRMPFGSMVVFLVKLALAAIPAMVILGVIGMVLAALGAAIVGR